MKISSYLQLDNSITPRLVTGPFLGTFVERSHAGAYSLFCVKFRAYGFFPACVREVIIYDCRQNVFRTRPKTLRHRLGATLSHATVLELHRPLRYHHLIAKGGHAIAGQK